MGWISDGAKGNEGHKHCWPPGMVCVLEDPDTGQDPVGWHMAVDVLTHAGSSALGTAPGIHEALTKISILEDLLLSQCGSWYFWGRIGWAGHSAVCRSWGAFHVQTSKTIKAGFSASCCGHVLLKDLHQLSQYILYCISGVILDMEILRMMHCIYTLNYHSLGLYLGQEEE